MLRSRLACPAGPRYPVLRWLRHGGAGCAGGWVLGQPALERTRHSWLLAASRDSRAHGEVRRLLPSFFRLHAQRHCAGLLPPVRGCPCLPRCCAAGYLLPAGRPLGVLRPPRAVGARAFSSWAACPVTLLPGCAFGLGWAVRPPRRWPWVAVVCQYSGSSWFSVWVPIMDSCLCFLLVHRVHLGRFCPPGCIQGDLDGTCPGWPFGQLRAGALREHSEPWAPGARGTFGAPRLWLWPAGSVCLSLACCGRVRGEGLAHGLGRSSDPGLWRLGSTEHRE